MINSHPLYVLVACEESQAECKAFRDLGHYAFSCDIQPCRPSANPAWHIHADVRPLLHGEHHFTTQDGQPHEVLRWDLIIAHPPCTYLSKVGSPWLFVNCNLYISTQKGLMHINSERFYNMLAGREFFFECLQAQADHVAVENPIPMTLADLPRPDCYADPSWYGVKYTKKTLYWLKNLPPLMAEINFPNARSYHYSSRGKYRSRTFPAMAQAIARQWAQYILDNPKP